MYVYYNVYLFTMNWTLARSGLIDSRTIILDRFERGILQNGPRCPENIDMYWYTPPPYTLYHPRKPGLRYFQYLSNTNERKKIGYYFILLARVNKLRPVVSF